MTTNRNGSGTTNCTLIGVIFATLGSFGCAAAIDTESMESVASDEAAFSTGACATARADNAIVGIGSVATPRTYNTCGKGYVVDVFHHNSTRAGAVWNDDLPATSAGCRDISVTVKYYEKPFAGEWALKNEGRSVGTWIPFTGGCVPPSVSLPVTTADDFRIAATARVSTGELTRKMLVFASN